MTGGTLSGMGVAAFVLLWLWLRVIWHERVLRGKARQVWPCDGWKKGK